MTNKVRIILLGGALALGLAAPAGAEERRMGCIAPTTRIESFAATAARIAKLSPVNGVAVHPAIPNPVSVWSAGNEVLEGNGRSVGIRESCAPPA